MPELSADARNLNWLVTNFAKATPGVAHARAGDVLTPSLRAELQAILPT
jgi:hypothetical protein